MTTIARAGAADWPDIWALLEPVFRAGETYPYPPDISEAQARTAWMDTPLATFVARAEGGAAAGSYFLKANQPGLGAHVCNCGYVVGRNFRGRGVATQMCEHSQREALRMGFRAMQFNLVVSTNEGAARLWKRLGFGLVGTLPGAFHHRALGDIDAYVMYKRLAG
jgi:RimJ/RimL family protein N-acetyltransferase